MDGQKRKRVAFAEGVSESKDDTRQAKRSRAARDDGGENDHEDGKEDAEIASAARAARKDKLMAAYEEYDDNDVNTDVVGEVDAEAYDDIQDDENDEGNEEEYGLGADGDRKADNKQGGDDADGSTVKVLKKVKGEQRGRMEEEFNDAGEAFEPFNLSRERSEGYFDTTGNYVWKKRTADDYDAWLSGLDEMDPRERARLQHQAARSVGFEEADAAPANDEDADDDDDDKNSDAESDSGDVAPDAYKATLLKDMLRLLEDGETVAAALRRFSGKGKGREDERDMAAFNKLTEVSDALVRQGMTEIYSTSYKELLWEAEDACNVAKIPFDLGVSSDEQNSGAHDVTMTASNNAAPAAAWLPTTNTKWKYKWSLESGAEEYGPFTSAEMAAWKAAQFFSAAPAYVKEVKESSNVNATASSTTAATTTAADDDDDDIFSNAGKYAAADVWHPIADVTF